MSQSMIDMIDSLLTNFFPYPELFYKSPFSIEDLRNCILTFIIKYAYYLTEPKQSLKTYRGTDLDNARMRDSRNIAYAQHYRNLQYERIKNTSQIEIPELLPDDVKSMSGKLSGHKLTPMQYFEISNIADHPLLKAIASKRICDVKKISNAVFIEYMQDYDNFVNQLIKKLDGTDEEVIFATIALFTLEWKYCVEFFYSCAEAAEKNNTKEVPLKKLCALCGVINIPLPPPNKKIVTTESRFVLNRIKLVSKIFNSTDLEWAEIEDKMLRYLSAEFYITEAEFYTEADCNEFRKYNISEFFVEKTTRSQWAQFFREHYDLRKLYVPKEWTNRKIRYMRKLYRVMIADMAKPKS